MSLIRRISASITSSVDRAVSRVENHDAIINAALKDSQRAAAAARVRLERLRKDGTTLRRRRDETETAIERWSDRALRLANEDEDKALECLRRKRLASTQLQQTVEALAQHEALEQKITAQIRTLDARIQAVTQQRNQFRSRQSVADATRALNDAGVSPDGDIEDTFDRWEINLAESEIQGTTADLPDLLDSELGSAEEVDELKIELRELLVESRSGKR